MKQPPEVNKLSLLEPTPKAVRALKGHGIIISSQFIPAIIAATLAVEGFADAVNRTKPDKDAPRKT